MSKKKLFKEISIYVNKKNEREETIRFVYVVIQTQTLSLYHNSSVWLDTLGFRSLERNPVDSNANPRFYHSATRKPAQAKEI